MQQLSRLVLLSQAKLCIQVIAKRHKTKMLRGDDVQAMNKELSGSEKGTLG